MSIDKSTMKIFFEGMEGTFLSSGYSSKIVSTPMGPFKWNDTHELWENVNNGMVMNNISFQDMMLMGYETLGGGADRNEARDRIPVLVGSFGNIDGVRAAKATRWASTTGPQLLLANGNAVTINGINRPTRFNLLSLTSVGIGTVQARWSLNGGASSSASPFTVNNGDVLKIAGSFPDISEFVTVASGTISLRNSDQSNQVLATIPWSFDYTSP